ILLGRDGAIKVTDFGIARTAARTTGNLSGTFGTPGYLPPEALLSAAFTPMADLFAVGAVFYEVLTGQPPHTGKNAQETLVRTATVVPVSVRERNRSVPPAVDEIVLGLLQKDPTKRKPPSARELAEALDSIADKNGWKWTAPMLLTGETPWAIADSATAAIPLSGKLG
ncbi:MAG: protein kinase, partial [Vicinamibacteria bacterium]